MPKERGLQFAQAFFQASRSGDMKRLRQMLATDVTAYADGGGKIHATLEPIVGIEDVMDLHATLAHIFAEKMSRLLRYTFINGLPDSFRSSKTTCCKRPRSRLKTTKSWPSM